MVWHILGHCALKGFQVSKKIGRIWSQALRKKYPYSELFWSAFSRIRTEYSVEMRENTDQNNSEYGHFSRSPALID